MKRAVVLLSGGLDSATVLAIARADRYACHCLTIDYGQRHSIETECASRLAKQFGAEEHQFLTVPLNQFGGSALTDEISVPKDQLSDDIPVTYVPARNTVMLSVALAYAESRQIADIFIGVNAVDYSGYPDCRPEYIESFQTMARLATKSGVEGAEITIHAPLIDMRKAEIIKVGLSLGLDYSQTHSCYDPNDSGEACGHCDSCLIRVAAFGELGMADPVLGSRAK
ncbi:7-cyano-7-deazaguanine synthase QueC [Kamptonema cortianum]|nr:7-cyano-7-deazaguanine synthase QueC [Geitlerinema splendidum]MDK3157635.1 7-cyano-7-deazaguanine synthase QueC [Kamptonema cortianum]